jgi:hypothetical protein
MLLPERGFMMRQSGLHVNGIGENAATRRRSRRHPCPRAPSDERLESCEWSRRCLPKARAPRSNHATANGAAWKVAAFRRGWGCAIDPADPHPRRTHARSQCAGGQAVRDPERQATRTRGGADGKPGIGLGALHYCSVAGRGTDHSSSISRLAVPRHPRYCSCRSTSTILVLWFGAV